MPSTHHALTAATPPAWTSVAYVSRSPPTAGRGSTTPRPPFAKAPGEAPTPSFSIPSSPSTGWTLSRSSPWTRYRPSPSQMAGPFTTISHYFDLSSYKPERDSKPRVSVLRRKRCQNSDDIHDLSKHLSVDFTKYMLNSFSTKPLPSHVTLGDISPPPERLEVSIRCRDINSFATGEASSRSCMLAMVIDEQRKCSTLSAINMKASAGAGRGRDLRPRFVHSALRVKPNLPRVTGQGPRVELESKKDYGDHQKKSKKCRQSSGYAVRRLLLYDVVRKRKSAVSKKY